MYNLFASTSPDGKPRYPPFHDALRSERRTIFKLALINLGLVIVFMWTFVALCQLSYSPALQRIYADSATVDPPDFGSYYRQTQNANRLTVRILDLDSEYSAANPTASVAVLGPAVRAAALQSESRMLETQTIFVLNRAGLLFRCARIS